MIYFDLDGVLRDIHDAANIDPDCWDFKVKGKSIVEYFTENMNLLYLAKETEYFEIATFLKKYYEKSIIIISTQPKDWQSTTNDWLYYHFKYEPPLTIFSEDKLSYIYRDDILIEDSPNLADYSRVILIDKKYNRNIILPHTRVYNPQQLFTEIARRLYVNR